MASETPNSPVPPAITGEIGQFDASKLKHAETREKNPLPTKEGQYFCHLKKFVVYSRFQLHSTSFYCHRDTHKNWCVLDFSVILCMGGIPSPNPRL